MAGRCGIIKLLLLCGGKFMFGSFMGNVAGSFYYMFFQLAGFAAAAVLLKKEKLFTKLLTGSCMGSLLMHWAPVLVAFVLDFTLAAHIVAAVAVLPLFWLAVKQGDISADKAQLVQEVKSNRLFAVLFGLTFVLWCQLLSGHIIPLQDGALYTGQSTYGDMNMHLGFITSIAQQKSFPPMYSLFPGTKLAYPFLNASISSSLMVFGASLRWAYIFPMLFAFVQVVAGVYHFALAVLADKAKSLLCWVFYIFNGGLGFIYFMDYNGDYKFSDIFNGYYTTPTNLTDRNIRWVNIIADILLPQRASIFGYAMAFCALWLLYRAVWDGEKQYFIPAGIFAATLPLIHTHSFLAVVLISGGWLLLYLYRETAHNPRWYGAYGLGVFVVFMCIVQYFAKRQTLGQKHFFALGIAGLALCAVAGVILLCKYIREKDIKNLAKGWGIYLAIGVAVAAPQLFIWTFGQVAEGGFLRGHFNWGNLGDFYPWFYIKNFGLPLLLVIGAICRGGRKTGPMVAGAALVWFVAELILFTPNTYDNNKLLYVAYMLLCVAAADYGVELYRKLRSFGGAKVLSVCFVALSAFSAVLTLGRESISEYQVYGHAHLQLAQYVEENTAPDAVVLTNTRHNNEIAALTGRNIVCGSDIYLYFHGIDTSERKEHLRLMYEQPWQNLHLFEQYNVDYVVVSSYEWGEYDIDTGWLERNSTKVFDTDGVQMYQLKK